MGSTKVAVWQLEEKLKRCVPSLHLQPRLAQAVEPDFAVSGWLAKERIARGNVVCETCIGCSIHINAQDLAEQRGGVLPVANGSMHVAAATAVAERNVQESVVAEGQTSAIVIGFGLADSEQDALRVGVREVEISRRCGELRDDRVEAARIACVVHKEATIGGVLRMKGQT